MRADEFQESGGPEVLKVVEADAPEPAPDEVSVDVAYMGVNFADRKARSEGYRLPSLPFRPDLRSRAACERSAPVSPASPSGKRWPR